MTFQKLILFVIVQQNQIKFFGGLYFNTPITCNAYVYMKWYVCKWIV